MLEVIRKVQGVNAKKEKKKAKEKRIQGIDTVLNVHMKGNKDKKKKKV